MKVDIIIQGGLVQAVRKDASVELNIFDFDNDPVTQLEYKADSEVNEIDYEDLKKRCLRHFNIEEIIEAAKAASELLTDLKDLKEN